MPVTMGFATNESATNDHVGLENVAFPSRRTSCCAAGERSWWSSPASRWVFCSDPHSNDTRGVGVALDVGMASLPQKQHHRIRPMDTHGEWTQLTPQLTQLTDTTLQILFWSASLAGSW